MSKTKLKLKNILAEHFRDRFYVEGVKSLRRSLQKDENSNVYWEPIVRSIVNKELDSGEALNLIHNDANLPLDANTDEEAYKWLYLMLINSMGSEDSIIIEY
ncbi:hypothetical protein [Aquimarina rubra]|uniref:Uncharacterized protein n=1 Tax=Aquimarina rubra TaxID=1920033 RepID=A0ABW5LFM8_9FLAO